MDIGESYRQVVERIEEACIRAHRDVREVKLVVITKGQSAQKIIEVVNAGATLLGENYPEETNIKILEIGGKVKPNWHMVGHVQSRKIKYLENHFSMIHSVDSLELAQKLGTAFGTLGKTIQVLLEINVSGERSKSGFDCTDTAGEALLQNIVTEIGKMKNLSVAGLMTMPPYQEIGSTNRIYFSRCRSVLQLIKEKLELTDFNQLSMGTSIDFETAIEEGATYVRIGEAIMGPRLIKGSM